MNHAIDAGEQEQHRRHDDRAAPPAIGDHGDHAGHARDAGHGAHDKHAGHDPEIFRRKFWLSLALTIPLVVTSEMVMDWFGYSIDLPGQSWLGPVLGSIVFWWGGWPFLTGGVA
jgi:Cu2+-exporting ATPase